MAGYTSLEKTSEKRSILTHPVDTLFSGEQAYQLEDTESMFAIEGDCRNETLVC